MPNDINDLTLLTHRTESPFKIKCWEERVKTRRFSEEGIAVAQAQSDLAAGNAENVGGGKLHLYIIHILCVVLFILCLF